MILLLLVLAGSLFGAYTLQTRVSALEAENEAKVAAAQSELDAIKAAYAAIDPETDEGMARQIEAENQAIDEANEQAAALTQDSETLRADIRTLQSGISALEADEDNAYYLKVYESLHKGMEMVEGLLNGE